jgi:hypothetical protein
MKLSNGVSRPLVLALLALTFSAQAEAQPSTWSSYESGGLTHYQGTDQQGGSWYGTGYESGGMRYDNFTGPNGQSRRCRSYTSGGITRTQCDP